MNRPLGRSLRHGAMAQRKPARALLRDGRIEPRLEDLKDCDVLRAVMRRDDIQPEELDAVVDAARDLLAKRQAA